MAELYTRIWTKVLSNSILSVQENLSLTQLSLLLTSGSATISGDLEVGSMPSEPITLQTGVPITISSTSNYPLDGITIDASSGTVEIIGN